jgi:hypothetical protein
VSCKRCGHDCVGMYCEQCACEVAGRTPPPRRQDPEQIAQEAGIEFRQQRRPRTRRTPKTIPDPETSTTPRMTHRQERAARKQGMPSSARKLYKFTDPVRQPRDGRPRTLSEPVTEAPAPPKPRRKRKAKPGRGGSVHTIPTAFETDRRHH